jgi:hypothetical protein
VPENIPADQNVEGLEQVGRCRHDGSADVIS